MIKASLNLEHLGQSLKPTHVVTVEVRYDQVINSGQTSFLNRRNDPLRVPIALPGVTSINEQ